MKAVIYARYSTAMQRDASIEDQARNCRKIADREGWQVVETYSDKAISGTSSDRPGYQRMLVDAKARKFDVLIVDDLSRLSRDQVEGESAFRRLEHWDIRIIGASDGYDSNSKGRKVHRAIKGLMNEVYLDDLAEKTHRGLEGQARAGNNAGGRAYGYKHIPIEDATQRDPFGRPLVLAVKREIDPDQAKIVQQVYEWFADGQSPRWIASELNRLKIPSPGASWSRSERRKDGAWLASAIAGDATKGIGILNNDLYRGVYIWNRSRWVKDPETHRRVRQERPQSEWIMQTMPELQIISTELWQRVKARQTETQKKSTAIRTALHANARTGATGKYLLSGLLQCGVCGSNFVMANRVSYRCSSHVNGGVHACANGVMVSRVLAESKLLAGVKAELMQPAYLQEFEQTIRAMLAKQRGTQSADQEARSRRLSELDKEIANLVDAISTGLLSPAIKAKLQTAESEREQLANTKDERTLAKVIDALPRLADTYAELVADLENVPQRQVARARASLKQLLGDVRLVPENDSLIAEISLESNRLWSMVAGQQISMVAGAPYQRYLRLFQAFDIAAGPAALCTSSAVLSNSEGVRATRAAHSTGVTPRTATAQSSSGGGGHA